MVKNGREREAEQKVLDTFEVPVRDPAEGLNIQAKPPTVSLGADNLKPVISKLSEIEEGFVMYRILNPSVPNRFVLANTAFGATPALMSIVSGRYRVLRPSVALRMIDEALEHYHPHEKISVAATISKQVLVTIYGKDKSGLQMIYVNSFDRTARELLVLPGLRGIKYTHTNNGKHKHDMAGLVATAFNQEDFYKWQEKLAAAEVSKATFIRFIRVNLSTTPRTLLLKVFEYQDPISDLTDKDFENIAYQTYTQRYGTSLVGFVEFIHMYYKLKVSQNKLHRAVAAIQSGTKLVQTLVR